MTHKHAVITDTHVYTRSGDALAWEQICIPSMEEAWKYAQERDITHFWIMPESEPDRMGQAWFDADARVYNQFLRSNRLLLPMYARVRRQDHKGHEIIVHCPLRAGFNWQIDSPSDILDTIAYEEQAFGVVVEYSPKHTARQKLTQLWQKKPETLRDTTIDTRDLPFGEASYEIDFQRALTEDMIGQWVHHYDKNSNHLAAAGYVDMGIGDPVHMEGGTITGGLPGIYRVKWSLWEVGGNTFDGVMLPTIIDPRQNWITNDVLKFAMKRGYGVKILEAWVFPEYARILGHPRENGGLAKAIWNARQMLNPALSHFPNETAQYNAYDDCKEMAVTVVGAFMTGKTKQPDKRWIHANWWADVVGQARVAELANLEKYAKEAGAPIVIEADALYYVSRDSNPRSAVPGILDRQDQLGGYKHCGSCQLTREMFNEIVERPSHAADLFKAAGGE